MAAIFNAVVAIYKRIAANGTLLTYTSATPRFMMLDTQGRYELEPIIPGDTSSVTGVELKTMIVFPYNHGIQEVWFCNETTTAIQTKTNA